MPTSSITGNTTEKAIAGCKFPPDASATAPAAAGPEAHPRSPASARKAYIAVPPAGRAAAAAEKVPGQRTPTANPQTPHPSIPSSGTPREARTYPPMLSTPQKAIYRESFSRPAFFA